jgi:hypothetical protein
MKSDSSDLEEYKDISTVQDILPGTNQSRKHPSTSNLHVITNFNASPMIILQNKATKDSGKKKKGPKSRLM